MFKSSESFLSTSKAYFTVHAKIIKTAHGQPNKYSVKAHFHGQCATKLDKNQDKQLTWPCKHSALRHKKLEKFLFLETAVRNVFKTAARFATNSPFKRAYEI